MIIEHEFQEGGVQRCKWCGTSRAMFEASPQNVCVPRWSQGGEPTPRPCHTGQSVGDYAADDADVIYQRLMEREIERRAALNRPEETD